MKIVFFLYSLIVLAGIGFWLHGLIRDKKELNISFGLFVKRFWNLDFYPGRMEDNKRTEYCSLCGFVAVNSYLLGRLLSSIVVPVSDSVSGCLVAFIPFGLFLIQYMFFSRLSLKTITILVITLIPFTLNTMFYGEGLLPALVVMLCCAGINDLKAVLRNYSLLILVVVLISWLFSSVGILPSTILSSGGRNVTTSSRHALGFGHPNAAGIYVAIAAEIYLILRWNKIRWYEWIIPVLVILFIDRYVDSRGGFISLTITVMMMVLFKYYPQIINKRISSVLLVLVPAVVLAFSLYCSYCYNPEVLWMSKLNSMITGRLSLNQRAVRLLRISLFGNNTLFLMSDGINFDNTAVKYLLNGGVIIFSLFALWNTVLMVRLVKLNALPEIALAIGSYAYWFVENVASNPQWVIYTFLMGSVIIWAPIKEQRLFVEVKKQPQDEDF